VNIIPVATRQNAFRLAVISNIVLGTHVVAIKVGIESMEPLLFTTLRHMIMGTILVLMLPNLQFLKNHLARRALAIQTVLATVVMVLFVYGLELSSAISAAILSLIVPVCIYFFSVTILREPLLKRVMIGGSIALLGSVLMIGLPSIISNQFSPGDILLLLAYVTLSALVVHSKRSYEVLSPEAVLGVRTLVASVVLFASILLFMTPSDIALGSPLAWVLVLYSAIVCGVIGQTMYYRSLERMSAEQSAPLFYLDPMTGVLLSSIMLGETLPLGAVIGASVIIAGIAISHPVHMHIYHRMQVQEHPTLLSVVKALFRSFQHHVVGLRIARFSEFLIRK
jgi:O-acetylserine/cysteine efflux transporter